MKMVQCLTLMQKNKIFIQRFYMEINGKEIKINRKDAVVRDFDKQYCELLKKILEEGELFENRTGVDTLSIQVVDMYLMQVMNFLSQKVKK